MSALSPPKSPPSSPDPNLLVAGDIVGEGLPLNGELITPVPSIASRKRAHQPAAQFEVVGRLGTGSYAVVYLVREVLNEHLSRALQEDEDELCPAGELELDQDDRPPKHARTYGREYAIKCLSKANLNDDGVHAQLFEATVHQSLPIHPNIVTLYRTLETPSFLLLVLESVPGEDLFYFLESARDHQVSSDPHAPLISTSPSLALSLDLSVTPPTPSLLSSHHPAQLLSPSRLRLIASMFAQMCDAVAACHRVGVSHRDIKPENFIVTEAWANLPDGRRERRVIVKLTDFGLATTDVESADMECGSAPYMSYECRNNNAPTYFPQAADVWSLGIVLINMLYHRNPWSDTTVGTCTSFDFFLEHPIPFFLQSFTGMTPAVADFLANKVFCVLSEPSDTRRVTAAEFGAWVKNLPALMLGDSASASALSKSASGASNHREHNGITNGTTNGISRTHGQPHAQSHAHAAQAGYSRVPGSANDARPSVHVQRRGSGIIADAGAFSGSGSGSGIRSGVGLGLGLGQGHGGGIGGSGSGGAGVRVGAGVGARGSMGMGMVAGAVGDLNEDARAGSGLDAFGPDLRRLGLAGSRGLNEDGEMLGLGMEFSASGSGAASASMRDADAEDVMMLQSPRERDPDHDRERDGEDEHDPDPDADARTTSTTRRRKRGLRRGKGSQSQTQSNGQLSQQSSHQQLSLLHQQQSPQSLSLHMVSLSGEGGVGPLQVHGHGAADGGVQGDDILEQMASASQDLARQLSRMSAKSTPSSSRTPILDSASAAGSSASASGSGSIPPVPPLPSSANAGNTAWKTKWRGVLGFGDRDRGKDVSVDSASGGFEYDDFAPEYDERERSKSMPRYPHSNSHSHASSRHPHGAASPTATASNVSSLIMGLSPPGSQAQLSVSAFDSTDSLSRGRRRHRGPAEESSLSVASVRTMGSTTSVNLGGGGGGGGSEWSRANTPAASDRWKGDGERGESPAASMRSRRTAQSGTVTPISNYPSERERERHGAALGAHRDGHAHPAATSENWRNSTVSYAPSLASTYSYASSNFSHVTASSFSSYNSSHGHGSSAGGAGGAGFTRFSNSSMRSVNTVNTVATTVSAMSGSSALSWRAREQDREAEMAGVAAEKESGKPKEKALPVAPSAASAAPAPHSPQAPRRPQTNVKLMSGMPWELHELPRMYQPTPSPAGAKQKPKRQNTGGQQLQTISERPRTAASMTGSMSGSSSVAATTPGGAADSSGGQGNGDGADGDPSRLGTGMYYLQDAQTSTTGLGDGPKKVKAGQINALAKLLSGLKSR